MCSLIDSIRCDYVIATICTFYYYWSERMCKASATSGLSFFCIQRWSIPFQKRKLSLILPFVVSLRLLLSFNNKYGLLLGTYCLKFTNRTTTQNIFIILLHRKCLVRFINPNIEFPVCPTFVVCSKHHHTAADMNIPGSYGKYPYLMFCTKQKTEQHWSMMMIIGCCCGLTMSITGTRSSYTYATRRDRLIYVCCTQYSHVWGHSVYRGHWHI